MNGRRMDWRKTSHVGGAAYEPEISEFSGERHEASLLADKLFNDTGQAITFALRLRSKALKSSAKSATKKPYKKMNKTHAKRLVQWKAARRLLTRDSDQ